MTKILYVEDNDELRKQAKIWLSNYEIAEAEGVETAKIKLLALSGIELIISDFSMLNQDGLALIEAIEKDPRFIKYLNPRIPIIGYSGGSGNTDPERFELWKSKLDVYHQKPFKIPLLKTDIERLLLKNNITQR